MLPFQSAALEQITLIKMRKQGVFNLGNHSIWCRINDDRHGGYCSNTMVAVTYSWEVCGFVDRRASVSSRGLWVTGRHHARFMGA